MSQLNLHEIIRQQQEQLAAMQAQIQALLAAQGEAGAGGVATGTNAGSYMEVAKPAIFNGEVGRVGEFFFFFFFFKSTNYYMGRDGSPCLQEELCMEDQYPNLFM